MALGGLASNLSSPGFGMLKSALLCCQIFISIEQLLGNYAAMIQHIIRGLGIMHECRTRPGFIAENQDQLPLLDVFIIKLFSAPCKFADPPTTTHVNETTALPVCPISSHGQTVGPHNLRTIAPDMRTELTGLATSTLEFLDQASQAEFSSNTRRLRSEKASLLNSLESWRINLESIQAAMGHLGPEPISVSFLRLFHQILKIIVLGVLDSSPDLGKELQIERSQLQRVANVVGVRVMTYRMRNGASGDGSKRFKVY
ncbi:Zn2/Cys6 DNA-binding protein [Pochonia chlamydosporia 170]|uniref:Zn2/Cys6 DNA-binding protein n=1 Tax=Pochonia chlamydosporia 170 TaxID=1380566 RepID=A0A179FTH6_METCM|nr:Zn2/Cys6 DNA-binding protein [Pochonia chlamydosporia 170]OAQ68319.1 Zn2/Cys6 DNA-binding protein [Pochonia chlamydosporia 170]